MNMRICTIIGVILLTVAMVVPALAQQTTVETPWPDASLLATKMQYRTADFLSALDTAIETLPVEDQDKFRQVIWKSFFPNTADLDWEDSPILETYIEFARSKGVDVTHEETDTDIILHIPKHTP